jgi:lipopolysaccharide transport system ATP-binding protein
MRRWLIQEQALPMNDTVVRAENLGKQYRIGRRQRYRTLRDTITETATAPLRWLRRRPTAEGDGGVDNRIWALRDVAFEVKRGDVVGIIGRNGAGKSTLLKILSQITEPTTGEVEIRGRVGSLLEVGTGFHPELTGRENVLLNGAILGMKRAEILRKFDEIVAFAEVEKFIDTPVKHYSSGMYMRLAFAVAAHLESEILIVDEVLAVGDNEFQRKCVGKMGEVARGGRTVLFVSHNMQAVRQLCKAGLVLKQGRVAYTGTATECVGYYTADAPSSLEDSWEREAGVAGGPVTIRQVRVALTGQQPDHRLELALLLNSDGPHKEAFLAMDVLDGSGVTFMQAIPTCTPFIADNRSEHRLRVTVDLPPLVPGVYAVSVWVGSHNTETYDYAKGVVGFQIVTSPTPDRTFPHHAGTGWIVPKSRVEVLTP